MHLLTHHSNDRTVTDGEGSVSGRGLVVERRARGAEEDDDDGGKGMSEASVRVVGGGRYVGVLVML